MCNDSSSAASSISDAPTTSTTSGERKRAAAENKKLDKEEKKLRRELVKDAKEQEDVEEDVSSGLFLYIIAPLNVICNLGYKSCEGTLRCNPSWWIRVERRLVVPHIKKMYR